MKNTYIIVALIFFIISNSIAQDTSSENISSLGLFKPDGDREKDIVVKKLKKEGIVFFKADLDMDLDGCPFAYKPDNKGLCNNGNAKGSGSKSGFSKDIVLHEGDEIIVQDSTDVAPGYYISMTSLRTNGKAKTTAEYIDALKVPYVVLPSNLGIVRGDIVLVYNTRNDKYSFAINGDGNNTGIIGEGSAKLIEDLGLPLFKIDYYHCKDCSQYNYSKKCKKCKKDCDLFCEKCKMITKDNDAKDFIFVAFPNSAVLIKKNIISLDNLKIEAINQQGNLQIQPYSNVVTLINKLKQIL